MTEETAPRLAAPPDAVDEGRLDPSNRARLVTVLVVVVLLAASIVFWAGTLICAITSAWWLFLVGRGMQAVAIGMPALCYSLVRDIMPRSWVPITTDSSHRSEAAAIAAGVNAARELSLANWTKLKLL